MPAQTSIPVAATVLGTIGTVFWCIQLVPQVFFNWRKKGTEGLPALMMFLWVACSWHPIDRLIRFYCTQMFLQVPYRSEFTQSCR